MVCDLYKLIGAAFLIAVSACKTAQSSAKIVNGYDADAWSPAFLESVVLLAWSESDGKHYEASAIVLPGGLLLTCAHVAANMQGSLQIFTNDSRSPAIDTDPDNLTYDINVPPEYPRDAATQPPRLDLMPMDLATIQLRGNIPYDKLKPISLSPYGVREGDRLTLVGWGNDEREHSGQRRYGTNIVDYLWTGSHHLIELVATIATGSSGDIGTCLDPLCFRFRRGASAPQAIAAHGDSGGGAFNSRGELVGLTIVSNSEDLTYLINIHDAATAAWLGKALAKVGVHFASGGYDHQWPLQIDGKRAPAEPGRTLQVDGVIFDGATGKHLYTEVPPDRTAPSSAVDEAAGADAAGDTPDASTHDSTGPSGDGADASRGDGHPR